jgi:hypothetical protein
MQPESKLVRKAQDLLTSKGAHVVKIHGGDNPFQAVGIPDLLGCYKGFSLALEAKMPGGKVSRIQQKFLRDHEEAGGISMVFYSIEDLERLLRKLDRKG